MNRIDGTVMKCNINANLPGVLKATVTIITDRATAGIKITQQVILRFVAPAGQHDSGISVKFVTAEGTKFYDGRQIFGVFGPQKMPTISPRRGKPLARCW